MFAGVPHDLFRVHNWRTDVETIGEVPAEFISQLCPEIDQPYPIQVNKPVLLDGNHDVIFSVGQVVPHEVAGMANHTKNILVGTGGKLAIDQSHFLGAVFGMEKLMGRGDNPVRRVYNEAFRTSKLKDMPIVWIQTVVGPRKDRTLAIRGLYIGDGTQVFDDACKLAQQVNLTMLDKRVKKAVVFLDDKEFKTTWLGNKSIYRTRLAMETGGELLVIAPGVHKFGEDDKIDVLIRKYGYRKTPEILANLDPEKNPHGTEAAKELDANKSAVAHLIHGSSEGRFTIRYCPGHLTREEVTGVGFEYGDISENIKKYFPDGTASENLKDGWHNVDGEEVFYISNPALGLWAYGPDFQPAKKQRTE